MPPVRARLARRPETPRPIAMEAPPRKPMASTRRLSVFQRKVETGLSPTALELVFEQMRLVSEGRLDGDLYAGSTMITIDLAALAPRISDDADAATARRIAELAPEDPRVRARARAVALAEARRLAGDALIQPEIDLEIRARGHAVCFALDVEAVLAAPRRHDPVPGGSR